MGTRGSNPFSKAFYGFHTYIRGIGWLLKNKKYLFMIFLPTIVGLIALVTGWGFFLGNFGGVIQGIVFDKPDSWYMLTLYWFVYSLAFLGVVGGALVGCLLLVNILASPLYDMVSAAVEKELTGDVKEVSLWASMRLMGEELKKVAFILAVSSVSFILTTIFPLFSIIAILVTAFLLGWDFYDYPLARRGLGFRQRLDAVIKDRWSVMAFGLWMLVPFVQFLLMPLAVAGGTILCIEGLEESAL